MGQLSANEKFQAQPMTCCSLLLLTVLQMVGMVVYKKNTQTPDMFSASIWKGSIKEEVDTRLKNDYVFRVYLVLVSVESKAYN